MLNPTMMSQGGNGNNDGNLSTLLMMLVANGNGNSGSTSGSSISPILWAFAMPRFLSIVDGVPAAAMRCAKHWRTWKDVALRTFRESIRSDASTLSNRGNRNRNGGGRLTLNAPLTDKRINALLWYCQNCQDGCAPITELEEHDRILIPKPRRVFAVIDPANKGRSFQCVIDVSVREIKVTSENNRELDKRVNEELLHVDLTSPDVSAGHILASVEKMVRFREDDQEGIHPDELYILEYLLNRSKSKYDGYTGQMMIDPPNNYVVASPFHCTRSLKNVYLPLEQHEMLRSRVDFFMHRQNWYEDHGVPYNLGILLHGRPGTGKTSTAKALAVEMKRHLVIVSLRNVPNKAALDDLFYSDVMVLHNEKPIHVPVDKRIYLFEDVDCDSEIVLDRSILLDKRKRERERRKRKENDENKKRRKCDDGSGMRALIVDGQVDEGKEDEDDEEDHESDDKSPDGLTLADLLNVLDGVKERKGCVTVWSTNRAEVLDSALIREGRIDVKLDLGNMDAHAITRMVVSTLELSDVDRESFLACEESADVIRNKLSGRLPACRGMASCMLALQQGSSTLSGSERAREVIRIMEAKVDEAA
jgi:hypothetical protein